MSDIRLLMSLQTLVPGRIWHVQQAIKVGPLPITTRSTLVKLKDGSLWGHSPVAPTGELEAAIAAIGPVRYVIAPNKSHHLFFSSFIARYSQARGYIAPGLSAKRPDLAVYAVLDETSIQAWSPELVGYFVEGIPTLNETVWFHPGTGTLILTDLLCCFGSQNKAVLRFLAGLLGVHEKLGMSRTIRLLVRDKAALARVARTLLTLDVHRIVLAHDQIVEADAKAKIEAAFAWLIR